MYRILSILVFALINAAIGFAQIKIFPGGLQSYGSTTSPGGSVKHRFSGDVVIGQSPTSTESAYIKGNATTSTAASPDYTWLNDVNTGIFHPAADNIGFSINGTERSRFNINGQFLFISNGGSWTPNLSWLGDEPTGIFHPSAGVVAITTGGSERMRVNNNGNMVLGGTSDGGARFSINGGTNQVTFASYHTHSSPYNYAMASYVNNSLTKAFVVYYNGTEKIQLRGDGYAWGTQWLTYSDESLKENIDSVADAIDKIKKLKGVEYNYKAETLNSNAMPGTVLPGGSPKRVMGLIAQDVEKVVPEVVFDDGNGVLGISYQSLVGLLIEGFKEQEKKIEKLENDLNKCCDKSGSRINTQSTGEGERNLNSEEKSNQNELFQNKPNPFHSETNIEYNVIEEGQASILIFDMNGKLLKTIAIKIPGHSFVTVSSRDLQPGMYYYSLLVNQKEVDTKKMILTE